MNIWQKSLLFYFTGAIVIAALLFIPAGTLGYWQAWLYLGVVLVPMLFVMLYFLATDPDFLERRFKMREREKEQQLFQKLGAPLILLGFILPGLGVRFGWQMATPEVSVAAAAIALAGYGIIFWVFHENSWAGRTIRVEKGQRVVSSGPYAHVRHPMYVGMIICYLATPLALGSFIALVPFLVFIPLLYIRISNEEKLLSEKLKGYREYCRKVRYRLVPGVW
jgi:protein-S-isoprenylcysteine O-methyltransferase Ste14